MNRNLDQIKQDIETNSQYGFLFGHTISTYSSDFSKVEVAILYLEDRRFFSHRGIEIRSFIRAIKRWFRGRGYGGVSTIDQQAVRISLGRYERTVTRKMNELILAFCINLHKSKHDIFNYYIHNAYLGYKMEGCEVASQRSFQCGAAFLDSEQSAFIASLFPLPFPKVVWDAYEIHPDYPFTEPNMIIDLASNLAPRWASRMKYRMAVSSNGYDFNPSNR